MAQVNWKELDKRQKEEDKRTRVVGYVRVSTYDQVKGVSIEKQKEEIKNWVKYKKYTLVGFYVDGGKSGASKNRPSFNEMMDDAGKDVFDMIACYKIDRFARSARIAHEALYTLNDLDVGLKFLSPELDTRDSTGQLIFSMFAQFAQIEKEMISERLMMGKMDKLYKGNYISKKPFGYNVDNGELIKNEDEAYWVDQIFKMSAYNFMSYRKIADELNKQDAPLPTKRSKKWSYNTVEKIIKNDLYRGKYIYNGDEIPLDFEPIVSHSIWARANKQRQKAGKAQ